MNENFNNQTGMGGTPNQNFNNQANMGGMQMSNQNFNNQTNMRGMPTQNYNVPNNSGQGNKNIIPIIIGIIVVVVIGVLAYLAFGNKPNNDTPTTNASNGGITEPTPVKANSYYKVNYGDFSFSIPDNLQYVEQDGNLIIANAEDTWEALLSMTQGSFETLKTKRNQLNGATSAGWTASNPQLKKYDGVEFITVDATSSGQNVVLAYSKLNSMYIGSFTIINIDNEFDYEPLNELASIIKTATYNSSSNSIKGLNKNSKAATDLITGITK